MRAGPNRAASWANLKGSSRSRFDFPNNQHGALVGPSSFVDEVPEDAQVRRGLESRCHGRPCGAGREVL